jgi:hypothetical protein
MVLLNIFLTFATSYEVAVLSTAEDVANAVDYNLYSLFIIMLQ